MVADNASHICWPWTTCNGSQRNRFDVRAQTAFHGRDEPLAQHAEAHPQRRDDGRHQDAQPNGPKQTLRIALSAVPFDGLLNALAVHFGQHLEPHGFQDGIGRDHSHDGHVTAANDQADRAWHDLERAGGDGGVSRHLANAGFDRRLPAPRRGRSWSP